MLLITKEQIQTLLPGLSLLESIEQGFVQYSAGNCVVPPVGELLLEKGEVHIKYGCIRHERFYVIKIASGFYQNPELGLPSSNGLMQLFEQETGELAAILLDEGMLTDIRTAAAGAVCAKHLAPEQVTQIGIVGTGIQARLQLQYLQQVLDCKRVMVWGRSKQKMLQYQTDMQAQGFDITLAEDARQLCQSSQLIVTTTPSQSALLESDWIQAGTHITAVGSDTPDKQELDCNILAKADVLVADSISQCLQRGEIAQGLKADVIQVSQIRELGDLIQSGEGRTSSQHITVADLTGVAVQDIKIAEAVYQRAVEQGES